MRRHFIIPTIALALLALTSIPGTAQAQWAQLGCRDVDFGVDRDVIRVDRRNGGFTGIRLRAGNNAIRVLDVKVVYGNGMADDLPVRAVIPANGSSGVLDLRGAERTIDRIELIYAPVANFRGRARICVDGREAARPPTWVQLGCRDVDLNLDRDVVRVGRQDGTFSAIRLRAAGNAVQVLDLKVVYGSGRRDDIAVRARIPEGGTSGPLDLRGGARGIERIEMIYARVPNFRGRARLCVDGRPG